MPRAVIELALQRQLEQAAAALSEDERQRMFDAFDGLTCEMSVLSPSEWAESKRYLPPQLTPMPGYYRFDVAPYLREIVDCVGVESPVREVIVMKGVQLGVTVGVIENAIGYFIDHVKTAPVMAVTADSELAKQRMESNVIPMIEDSGLGSLIRSADVTNRRKTGKTDRKIEWEGGGFLVPFGAKNANKLRSVSIQVLLRDEIDGWPDVVGQDGDPMQLSFDRTVAYEATRKVVDVSTPLIQGQSKIARRFAQGDQRHYLVCCLGCGYPQELRFRRTDDATGEVSGIVWESESGRLVPESVRYLCCNCGHEHFNDDKTRLLAPENGAQWQPTAEPVSPEVRSYHLNALYSPVGMQTWGACVQRWLAAWDEENARPRDLGHLQVFYNSVLGRTFELRGEKLRFETVSQHRRPEYHCGEVPNQLAVEYCGSPVLLLTCAVDIHQHELPVAVWGWCRDRRSVLVDYWRLQGDTEQLEDAGTWGAVRKLIEDTEYIADDGKRYRVQLTLVDSGYRTDTAYRFCADYEAGVYPIKGREAPPRGAAIREFSPFTTPMGTTGYNLTVDMYKERISASLRRSWDGQNVQPAGAFNAPIDATDKQLRELTVETKRQRIQQSTGKVVGWEWHRPSGAANELWDLFIYNTAALDLIAWNVSRAQFGLETVNWPAFFDWLAAEQPFFEDPPQA